MKILIVASISLLTAASSAQAAQVYLECETLNKHSNKTTHYKITLDEAAQSAVFTDDGLALNKTYTVPAQFTQTEVNFNWTLQGLGVTMYHKIDRINLQFSRNAMRNPEKTDYGTCKVAEPVERKF